MPINSTGPIALGSGSVGQSINLQLGKAIDATISMNDSDVRALAQKSVAGQTISFFDFYGKPITPSPTPAASSTPAVSPSRTPSATPAVTPSITPQPTPSRTPAVTPSPSVLVVNYTATQYSCDDCPALSTPLGSVVIKFFGTPAYSYYGDGFGNVFFITGTTNAAENFDETALPLFGSTCNVVCFG